MIQRVRHPSRPNDDSHDVRHGGGPVGLHPTRGGVFVSAVAARPRPPLSDKERERQRVYSANYRAAHRP